MTGTFAVLDAPVILALHDPRHHLHSLARRIVRECVLNGDRLVVPATAFAEALSAAHRRGPFAVRTITRFATTFADRVSPISDVLATLAAGYHAQHPGLPLELAYVLATAKHTAAASLLTMDQRCAQILPGLAYPLASQADPADLAPDKYQEHR